MFTNSKLAKSIRLAVAFGAASSTVIASNAFAQEEEGEGVEKIEVTGSRIKQTDLEGAAPVTIISRDDILATGITDVGDLIQRLPAMSGSPLGTTTNNGGTGAVQVNLRGLGAIRTLVLINGRRVVEGNDFQTIPATMIKRVEILKDGASAVYGADAVAGVVNIITRDDFEGLELEYQYTEAFDVDNSAQHRFSLISGKAFDGGNVVFGIEYVDQDPITQGDTDVDFLNNSFFIVDGDLYDEFGFLPPSDPNSALFPVGSSRIPGSNLNFNPNSQFISSPSESLTLDPAFFGGNGIVTADQFRPYVGSGAVNDTYNYAPVNFIQTPFERYNVFAETNFEITDTLIFNSLVRFNSRTSAQELAPVPYDTQFDPGFQVETLDADGNPTGNFQNGISADNVYNPFGEDIIRSRRRMVEANRRFDQDITQVQAIFGLEGELTDSWFWDATYNYGYRSGSFVDRGQYVGARLELALGPSFFDDNGNAVCGTPDAPIDGCVPLNLFGGPGTVTQEQLDYVSAPLVDTFQSSLEILTLGVTGEVEGFGAGPIGLAFGYEHRDQDVRNATDSGKLTEAVTGNSGGVAAGSYHVNSLFGEVFVPILDGDMTLDFTGGFRYDDYSTFGSNTTYQAKLVFAPFDGLLLRATVGEVFREPNIAELFSPQQDSFPSGQDPCNTGSFGGLTAEQQGRCLAQGVPQGGYIQTDTQYRGRQGGNPDLAPEEGDTVTLGVAWSPDFAEGFSITLDYWKIEIDEVITTLNEQTILEGCVIGGIDSLCSNIQRFGDGRIDAVFSVTNNFDTREAEGIDAEFRYNMETEFGDFNFGLLWTHLLERNDIVVGVNDAGEVGQVTIEQAGRFSLDDDEAFAENKINASIDWIWDDLAVSYLIEHIDGIEAEANFIDYTQYVGSQTYHDLTATYNFETDTRVTLGIQNIFDKQPPYIDAAFNGSTDEATYRLFGRTVFFRLQQSF